MKSWNNSCKNWFQEAMRKLYSSIPNTQMTFRWSASRSNRCWRLSQSKTQNKDQIVTEATANRNLNKYSKTTKPPYQPLPPSAMLTLSMPNKDPKLRKMKMARSLKIRLTNSSKWRLKTKIKVINSPPLTTSKQIPQPSTQSSIKMRLVSFLSFL